ncbi:MAG TPA: hypothetical protein VMP42_00095 [Actinomycetota bacterium]|nr:hypothetical protein [Actinomycetota bacterium]
MTRRATAFEALQRELYWAGAEEAGTQRSAEELRVALHRLAERLRDDLTGSKPSPEWDLHRGSPWRRWLKRLLHRLLRPVHRRYSTIMAELASLGAGLAARLERAEAAVERLEAEIDAMRKEPVAHQDPMPLSSAPVDAYEQLAESLRGDGEEAPLWIDVGAEGSELAERLDAWGWRTLGTGARVELASSDPAAFLEAYDGEPPRVISVRGADTLRGSGRGPLLERARRLLGRGGVLLVELAAPAEDDAATPGPRSEAPPHPESIRLAALHAGFERTELVAAGGRVVLRAETG